jgi:hypothetical protein
MSAITVAWSLGISLLPVLEIPGYNSHSSTMVSREWSYDRKPLAPTRLQFALGLTLLIICFVPAAAQTAGSSNNLTSRLSKTHAGSSFGSVDDRVPDAVDANVQTYTGAVGSGDAGVSSAGSGLHAKASASLAKLQAGSSPANVLSQLSQKMQSMRSHVSPGPSGVARREIAVLNGAAKPQTDVRTILPLGMPSGPVSKVRKQGASLPPGMRSGPASDIQGPASDIQGPVSDIQEQGAPHDNAGATESGATPFETSAFPEDRESIGDSFGKSVSTSFEEICIQDCGSLTKSRMAAGRPTTGNWAPVLRNGASRSTTRLHVSNMAGDVEAQRILGILSAGESRLEGRLSAQGQRDVQRGSKGRH